MRDVREGRAVTTARTLYFCSHCHGESKLTISNLTFTYTEKHTRDCPNRPEPVELERCLRLITRPAAVAAAWASKP